jgi:hypothetical protein
MCGMPEVETVATPIDGRPACVARCYDLDPAAWPGVGFTDANAELIALAPELAEAVLAWSDCPCDRQCYDCGDRLVAAATKLRQIGGAS